MSCKTEAMLPSSSAAPVKKAVIFQIILKNSLTTGPQSLIILFVSLRGSLCF